MSNSAAQETKTSTTTINPICQLAGQDGGCAENTQAIRMVELEEDNGTRTFIDTCHKCAVALLRASHEQMKKKQAGLLGRDDSILRVRYCNGKKFDFMVAVVEGNGGGLEVRTKDGALTCSGKFWNGTDCSYPPASNATGVAFGGKAFVLCPDCDQAARMAYDMTGKSAISPIDWDAVLVRAKRQADEIELKARREAEAARLSKPSIFAAMVTKSGTRPMRKGPQDMKVVRHLREPNAA